MSRGLTGPCAEVLGAIVAMMHLVDGPAMLAHLVTLIECMGSNMMSICESRIIGTLLQMAAGIEKGGEADQAGCTFECMNKTIGDVCQIQPYLFSNPVVCCYLKMYVSSLRGGGGGESQQDDIGLIRTILTPALKLVLNNGVYDTVSQMVGRVMQSLQPYVEEDAPPAPKSMGAAEVMWAVISADIEGDEEWADMAVKICTDIVDGCVPKSTGDVPKTFPHLPCIRDLTTLAANEAHRKAMGDRGDDIFPSTVLRKVQSSRGAVSDTGRSLVMLVVIIQRTLETHGIPSIAKFNDQERGGRTPEQDMVDIFLGLAWIQLAVDTLHPKIMDDVSNHTFFRSVPRRDDDMRDGDAGKLVTASISATFEAICGDSAIQWSIHIVSSMAASLHTLGSDSSFGTTGDMLLVSRLLGAVMNLPRLTEVVNSVMNPEDESVSPSRRRGASSLGTFNQTDALEKAVTFLSDLLKNIHDSIFRKKKNSIVHAHAALSCIATEAFVLIARYVSVLILTVKEPDYNGVVFNTSWMPRVIDGFKTDSQLLGAENGADRKRSLARFAAATCALSVAFSKLGVAILPHLESVMSVVLPSLEEQINSTESEIKSGEFQNEESDEIHFCIVLLNAITDVLGPYTVPYVGKILELTLMSPAIPAICESAGSDPLEDVLSSQNVNSDSVMAANCAEAMRKALRGSFLGIPTEKLLQGGRLAPSLKLGELLIGIYLNLAGKVRPKFLIECATTWLKNHGEILTGETSTDTAELSTTDFKTARLLCAVAVGIRRQKPATIEKQALHVSRFFSFIVNCIQMRAEKLPANAESGGAYRGIGVRVSMGRKDREALRDSLSTMKDTEWDDTGSNRWQNWLRLIPTSSCILGILSVGSSELLRAWCPKTNEENLSKMIHEAKSHARASSTTILSDTTLDGASDSPASPQSIVLGHYLLQLYGTVATTLGDLGILGSLPDLSGDIGTILAASCQNAFAASMATKGKKKGGSPSKKRKALALIDANDATYWWADLGIAALQCVATISHALKASPPDYWSSVATPVARCMEVNAVLEAGSKISAVWSSCVSDAIINTMTIFADAPEHLTVITKEILTSSRLANRSVQICTLSILKKSWETLGHAMMCTLQETKPVLVELLDDSDAQIEWATAGVCESLEKVTGKSIAAITSK
eukprot:GHVO01069573.1.p1 GENE.GHVO01069573.1~~GHVO01069573.1.p1  ORF type:complete len:1164 (+),score=266.26 GHVO01069573.1:59-3550(+)